MAQIYRDSQGRQVYDHQGQTFDAQTGKVLGTAPVVPTAPVPVADTPAAPAVPETTPTPATPGIPAPAALPVPSTPAAPSAPVPQIKPYVVQSGDTLGAIALKFGVPISSISGYRSGDPNKIFPGETLSIGSSTPQTSTPTPPSPEVPDATRLNDEELGRLYMQAFMESIRGDTGEPVDPTGLFTNYGVDTGALPTGFQTNPQATVQDLVTQVMQATALPEAKSNIEDLSRRIEEIENARDEEFKAIDDNPFISAGTKRERKQQIEDRYEKKLANRINSLKLLQDAYDSAREEARFAASTAINLYDRNRQFNQERLEFAITQAEKRLATIQDMAKLNPAEFKEVNGGLFNIRTNEWVVPPKATGKATSTISAAVPAGADASDPFIQTILNSAGGKALTDTTIQKLDKGLGVLGQLGVLQSNIQNTKTGPIIGLFRGNNPWDTNAQTIRAQLNAIVPNLARGVFGEVGVLTDNDIKIYAKTLPNLTSTEAVRNAILYITLDMIGKSIKNSLNVNAAAGRDVSGFVDIYTEMEATKNSILGSIPGAQVPGAFKQNEEEYTSAETAKVGATVEIGGKKYKKTGADSYEPI